MITSSHWIKVIINNSSYKLIISTRLPRLTRSLPQDCRLQLFSTLSLMRKAQWSNQHKVILTTIQPTQLQHERGNVFHSKTRRKKNHWKTRDREMMKMKRGWQNERERMKTYTQTRIASFAHELKTMTAVATEQAKIPLPAPSSSLHNTKQKKEKIYSFFSHLIIDMTDTTSQLRWTDKNDNKERQKGRGSLRRKHLIIFPSSLFPWSKYRRKDHTLMHHNFLEGDLFYYSQRTTLTADVMKHTM